MSFTQHTITDSRALLRDLAFVRQRSHASDDEERGSGIRSLAAPARRADGTVASAISIAGQIFRITIDILPRYREWLLGVT